MFKERDRLRTTEHALHAVCDALQSNVEGWSGAGVPAATLVLRQCMVHLKQVYTLVRYRALARMDEMTLIDSTTGLPSSVEISKVYHDTAMLAVSDAQLTAEKASIADHILSKKNVPVAFIDKAVRTAYVEFAARSELGDAFFVSAPAEQTVEKEWWCVWFNHTVNGQLAIYLMRFELDESAQPEQILGLVAKEIPHGTMTSPGVFAARLDEEIIGLRPKEVHAWFLTELILGDTLVGTPGSPWQDDEFVMTVTYEQARSIGEKRAAQGFFKSDVMRQVWETAADPICQSRLLSRQKNLLFAPHAVLQRMHKEILHRSLEPIATNINTREGVSHEWA